MVPTLSRDLKHLLLVIFVVDKHHPTANFTVQCPLNNHPKCTIVLKLEKVCTLQNLKAVEKRFTSQYLVNTHLLQILWCQDSSPSNWKFFPICLMVSNQHLAVSTAEVSGQQTKCVECKIWVTGLVQGIKESHIIHEYSDTDKYEEGSHCDLLNVLTRIRIQGNKA